MGVETNVDALHKCGAPGQIGLHCTLEGCVLLTSVVLWFFHSRVLMKHESVTPSSGLLSYFTFVYRLYHSERCAKKETFVCCMLECLGRRDVVQR